MIKIRRVLFSVSDKTDIVPLGRAFQKAGAELVATGRTAKVLEEAGLRVVPIEKISGSPEAFRGRMKTLSFPVCSGILYRRGDAQDETDLKSLGLKTIDAVVVNFYPFESAASRQGIQRAELIEEVDIGGPTLVRAAAKNAPDVLVLTSPHQYSRVLQELETHSAIQEETSHACAAQAWDRVFAYDQAIAAVLGATALTATSSASADSSAGSDLVSRSSSHLSSSVGSSWSGKTLRYGENPHQTARVEWTAQSPIAWEEKLTDAELSYNNILDLTAAYALASDLEEINPQSSGVVIVKHNNPCGVASIPLSTSSAQMQALLHAWDGDPVSAFGGVVVFTKPLEKQTAEWLREHFIELVAAPELSTQSLEVQTLLGKRKNLKAVRIRRFGGMPQETSVQIPGGRLFQSADLALDAEFKTVTETPWVTDPKDLASKNRLARFGVSVCRVLKSNAIALVREIPSIPGGMQLVGAGQGQPNRIDALQILALPRARSVLLKEVKSGGLFRNPSAEKTDQPTREHRGEVTTLLKRERPGSRIEDCILISDAFFPFRDTVDAAYEGGVRSIVQPGGSLRDAESIQACNEHGITMVFTALRHFRH